MKKRIHCSAFFILLLLCTGCGQKRNPSPVETFLMAPSTKGTDAFSAHMERPDAGNEQDICINVTPDYISDTYHFTIYKFDSSCASFLLYEDNIYPLGEWFGGLGVTSFAVADMNEDGEQELYFTFSWGSGIHRSQIGYFDTALKTVTVFNYSNYTGDMLLKTDGTGSLFACNAVCDVTSFVDINLTGETKAASILYESGVISLVSEEAFSPTDMQNRPDTGQSVQ